MQAGDIIDLDADKEKFNEEPFIPLTIHHLDQNQSPSQDSNQTSSQDSSQSSVQSEVQPTSQLTSHQPVAKEMSLQGSIGSVILLLFFLYALYTLFHDSDMNGMLVLKTFILVLIVGMLQQLLI